MKVAFQIGECLILFFFAFAGAAVVLLITFFFTWLVLIAGMAGLSAFSQFAFGKALSLPFS